jgi:uncharacterized membrane protein
MRSLYQFLKTALVGGVVVLVPIAVCTYIILVVVKAVLKVLEPIARLLPIKNLAGIPIAEILVIPLLLVVCFVLGLGVRAGGIQALGRCLEERLLNLLPGYTLIKKITQQFAGGTDEGLGKPVLVNLGASRQIGFLIEELPADEITVFVPLSPALSIVSVHIVAASQVQKLDAKMRQVIDCVTMVGFGSSSVIKGPKGECPGAIEEGTAGKT